MTEPALEPGCRCPARDGTNPGQAANHPVLAVCIEQPGPDGLCGYCRLWHDAA